MYLDRYSGKHKNINCKLLTAAQFFLNLSLFIIRSMISSVIIKYNIT